MAIRLSIIVPFYGVEQYIEQCVRSLCSQDLPLDEYEVICVDDCSPDNSRKIVESLQSEYPQIRLVVMQYNLKQGGARNVGLKMARGKYVWFVDSDDFIESNCIGSLVRMAESNDLDMLHFDFKCYSDLDNVINGVVSYEDDTIRTGISFFEDESNEKWAKRCAVVWRRLFNRDFLINNNLFFIENLKYEDTDWSIRSFVVAERVMHANFSPYCYRTNPYSTTHSKINAQKLLFEILLLNRCASFYKDIPSEKMQNMILKYVRSELSVLRYKIKQLPLREKHKYAIIIFCEKTGRLKEFCNWRTWFAVKYGITWFLPTKK